MSILVVADIVEITKVVVTEIHRRVEAAKYLKEECRSLDSACAQVSAVVADLPRTSAVTAGVNATKQLLDEVLAWVEETTQFVKTTGCCGRVAKSTDHLSRIQSFEERLMKQVHLLSSLVTISGAGDSVRGVIENGEAARWWINAFGETERQVPWPTFRDSVVASTDCEVQTAEDLRASLVVDSDSTDVPMVSAIKFGKVFVTGPIENTIKSIVSQQAEDRRVWRITVRDKDTKEEIDIDAGFVLIPKDASLCTVRGEVVANAQDDDELDERGEFLTIDPGKFTFYVQYDPKKEQWSRVKKNQEQLIKDRKVIDSAVICPDPVSAAPPKTTIDASTKYKVDVTPVTDEEPEAEEEATVDKNIGVTRQVVKDSRAEWAAGLKLANILEDPSLMQALRAICVQQGVREENVEFLRRNHQAKQWATQEEVQQRGVVPSQQWQKDFFGPNSPYELLLTEATRAEASVERAQAELEAHIGGAPLEQLKERLVKVPRTKLGKRTRIVIIGGGFAGTGACILCNNKLPQCHVTLIDTKEYFEDTPLVLRAMCYPEVFAKMHIEHKDYMSEDSTLLVGKVVELNSDHVVVNANRQIVPFDYCLNFTGSSYYSDIKSDNTSTAHRAKRFEVEKASIANSERVLVIGGGLVGTELSSDIKEAFPDKEVILIHSGDKLLKRMPEAHEHAYPHIQSVIKTDIRFNERVLPYRGTGDFETDMGNTIKAEGTRVYWATGYIPNTQHIKASKELTSSLDERGFIKLEPTMQVVGAPRIFSGGDCVEAKFFSNGERMALFADLHSGFCVRQLELIINEGRPLDQLLHFTLPKSDAPLAMVELGMVNALIQSPAEYDPFWGMFGLIEEANKMVPSPMADPEHPRYNPYCAGARIGVIKASHVKMMWTEMTVGRWSSKEGRAAWSEESAGAAMLLGLWFDPTAPPPEEGKEEAKEESK